MLSNTSTPVVRLMTTDPKTKQQTEVDRVNRAWVERVQKISTRMSSEYGFTSVPELAISKQNGPNAFVTNGKNGPVMVFGTDMLRLVGDDDDLVATVIGHEFGHLKGDHLRKGERDRAVVGLIGLLAGLVVDLDQAKQGVNTGGLGTQLGQAGAGLVVAKFSRDQEREADAWGIEYMARGGYDPSAAPKLWDLMNRAGSGGSGLWTSTHPSNAERQQSLAAAAVIYRPTYLATKAPEPSNIGLASTTAPQVGVVNKPSTIWLFCDSSKKMVVEGTYCPPIPSVISPSAPPVLALRKPSVTYEYCETTGRMEIEGSNACPAPVKTVAAHTPPAALKPSMTYVFCDSTQKMILEGKEICPAPLPSVVSQATISPPGSPGPTQSAVSPPTQVSSTASAEVIGVSNGAKNDKPDLSVNLIRCDQQAAEGCVLAAIELSTGKGYAELGDEDTRKRMALRLLEKAAKLGNAEATLLQYDMYEEAKLPSWIALSALQKTSLLEKDLLSMDRDDARLRVSHYRLTSLDPFASIIGTLGGSLKAHCDNVRLLKVKGQLTTKDLALAEKALATVHCKPQPN